MAINTDYLNKVLVSVSEEGLKEPNTMVYCSDFLFLDLRTFLDFN